MTFTVVLLSACSVLAQERFVYPVSDSNVIAKKDNVFRGDLKFDLYRPAGEAVVPVVIFANIGSRAYTTWSGYIGWGKACAEAGLAGVIYQATQENAIGDFDVLMSALRAKAGEFHIDPSRVIVWASSSNVQIGLPLAMDRTRDFIRAAVIYYGSGPVESIRQDVPLFLVRSGLDATPLNAQIDALIGRALTANAPWVIVNHGSGVHGFDVLDDNDVSREIIGRTLAFMKSAVHTSDAYAKLSSKAAVGAAFARGDWKTAIEGYRKIVTANDADAESHRRLGIALLQAKEYRDALRELERAYELGRRGFRDTAYPAALAAAGARNIERTVYWLDMVLASRFAPPFDQVRADFANVIDEPDVQRLLANRK